MASSVTKLPELAAAGGAQEGTTCTAEVSGKGWGAAEGPMDSEVWRAVSVVRFLGAGLPTHHLGIASKEDLLGAEVQAGQDGLPTVP